MRIGQVLLEAELISPKQLSDGLEYGTAKNIFLGKVMKLLKYVREEDIDRALHAQKLIIMGLSPVLAIRALKRSVKDRISLEQALQDEHLDTLCLAADSLKDKHLRCSSLELDNDDSLESRIKNGDRLLVQDCCSEALAQYQQALSILEKSPGADHIDHCPVLLRLGNTYLASNSFVLARECYEKVLSIRTKSLPDDHPLIAHAYESLADLYNAQGDGEQAISAFLSALDILEKKFRRNWARMRQS